MKFFLPPRLVGLFFRDAFSVVSFAFCVVIPTAIGETVTLCCTAPMQRRGTLWFEKSGAPSNTPFETSTFVKARILRLHDAPRHSAYADAWPTIESGGERRLNIVYNTKLPPAALRKRQRKKMKCICPHYP